MRQYGILISAFVIGLAGCRTTRSESELADAGGGGLAACEQTKKDYIEKIKEALRRFGLPETLLGQVLANKEVIYTELAKKFNVTVADIKTNSAKWQAIVSSDKEGNIERGLAALSESASSEMNLAEMGKETNGKCGALCNAAGATLLAAKGNAEIAAVPGVKEVVEGNVSDGKFIESQALSGAFEGAGVKVNGKLVNRASVINGAALVIQERAAAGKSLPRSYGSATAEAHVAALSSEGFAKAAASNQKAVESLITSYDVIAAELASESASEVVKEYFKNAPAAERGVIASRVFDRTSNAASAVQRLGLTAEERSFAVVTAAGTGSASEYVATNIESALAAQASAAENTRAAEVAIKQAEVLRQAVEEAQNRTVTGKTDAEISAERARHLNEAVAKARTTEYMEKARVARLEVARVALERRGSIAGKK